MMPKCVASGYHGDNVVSVEVYACRACRTLWRHGLYDRGRRCLFVTRLS